MKECTIFTDKEHIRGYMVSKDAEGVYLINIKSDQWSNCEELFISHSAIRIIAYY